jgi:GH25 family lysozyme M1 (1,4-beta-N-acetylmuramidase)
MRENHHQHRIGKIGVKRRVAVWGILAVAALSLTLGAGNAVAQTRALGIDVSRYQGTINWTSVRGAGIRFAWAQATRGLTSPNGNFTANMSNGKSAGVYMGAYHYAFPADSTPEVQADYFWNLAGPYIKADGKTMMPMLDMEVWSGYVGATSYTDWANKWCNRVIAKAAAVGVTVKPVIYTSACMACNFSSGISQWGAWIANYNGQNPQTGSPWSSCSSCNRWGTWHFWQYTDSGSVAGISGAVDRDVYNGTITDLASKWLATSNGGGGGTSIIVDNANAGFSASTAWSTGSSSTDKYGADYRYHQTQAVSDPATFSASLTSGSHAVSTWYPQGANRSQTAGYIISTSSGTSTVTVNQQINGGQWFPLGTFNMNSGANTVKISCWTTTGYVVMADAVKWD